MASALPEVASDEESDMSSQDSSVYSGLSEDPDTDTGTDDDASDIESDVVDEVPKPLRSIPLNDLNSLSTEITDTSKRRIGDSVVDEYADYDTSDEEDIRNTVGNIPLEWYDDLPHVGYTIDGSKLMKPIGRGEIDKFISKVDNPDYWRTIVDRGTGEEKVLSAEELDIVKRLFRGGIPHSSVDPFPKWLDIFTSEVEIHPLSNRPPDKRSFTPSAHEQRRVRRLVAAIRAGWLVPRDRKPVADPLFPQNYRDLWADETSGVGKRNQIVAPKTRLPGHAESYNPPEEYLFTREEEDRWSSQDPRKRRSDFIPRKVDALRKLVPYDRVIRDRFDRCLDLLMCPRVRKERVAISNPEELLPKLPRARDLEPFPRRLAVSYRGHRGPVLAVSTAPSGQWLASGGRDGTVRVWEVASGRCRHSYATGAAVTSVEWSPSGKLSLLVAATGNRVLIFLPGVGDSLLLQRTRSFLSALPASAETSLYPWEPLAPAPVGLHPRFAVSLPAASSLRQVVWHRQGDYFASVSHATSGGPSVLIHRVSRSHSQAPFSRPPGAVQAVCFHPVASQLFVATQRHVVIYDLAKQRLIKRLASNCKWVSSLAVHPGGENLIIGSYDCKLSWFDLELSCKPYRVLRHAKRAIRAVAFHPRYPLFASASDDGTLTVCHGTVYNDLLSNALVLPLRTLDAHSVTQDLGTMATAFHPVQPWVFSAGADGAIRLFSN